jgi:hypothetical protein
METIWESLRQEYEIDLKRLLDALPTRFHSIIQRCLDSLPDIMSLPMILLHGLLGICKVMVDEKSNHLTGVVGWSLAKIGPFGLNLHFLEETMGDLHYTEGWTRYDDYEALDKTFWDTLKKEAGLSEKDIPVIKLAMSAGLLLSWAFTPRLPTFPPPEPLKDHASGAYKFLTLDAHLINPATRFID